MKKPLISVIIPIYNIAEYLPDAIESIISQTIGLDLIEIILVNDGSTDNSETVCKSYFGKYPGNIHYIKQKNSGVSKARNTGFDKATGTYIHFFDGDDILSKDYYKRSIGFLQQHSEVDLVASKIKFFDETIDAHPLNNKFSDDHVIDTKINPNSPLLHVITCIFTRDSIRSVRFDERLTIAEDVKFISDVLCANPQYGVIKTPVYYYRKRSIGGSAISGKERNKDYYLKTPKYAYRHMIKAWDDTNIRTIEYTLLYDLSYRLSQSSQSILSSDEKGAYIEAIHDTIRSISDESLLSQDYLSIQQKIYALRIKYGDISHRLVNKNGTTYFDDIKLYDHANSDIYLDFITPLDGNNYKIEGYINDPISAATYSLTVRGKIYNLNFIERKQREQSFMDEVYAKGNAFSVQIELHPNDTISFIDTSNNKNHLRIHTGPFTRFGSLKYTYRRDRTLLFKRNSHAIEVYTHSKIRHVLLELRFWWQLLLNWRLRSAYDQYKKLRQRNLTQLSFKAKCMELAKPPFIVAEAILMLPRAFLLRTAYFIAVNRKRRSIWLITDRGIAAGDNAEALFRYIKGRDDCPADVLFVISKKSKDAARLKSIGKVVYQESFGYKLKFLLADKVISSQADVETTNPFLRQQDHYINLFNFDFVFLQHGIIRHNLSSWLNRYNKNIRLFITSAEKEYQSIFDNPYYYSKQNVLLSGLARYDYLQNQPNKKLILAPTYRKNLVKQKTDKNGVRGYDPSFKHSEYREFYNSFMNDDRLTQVLKKAGMTGEFYLHPVFSAQRADFDENEQFKVMEYPYDYRTAFKEGELLVSDHSSVVFDFSYLKKPVAYAHFDVDTFFDGHSYDKSNFFSDEQDGFGPVYYDYDTLVLGVINSIANKKGMEAKYQKRVDDFFYKVDTYNSERIYNAILKLDE